MPENMTPQLSAQEAEERAAAEREAWKNAVKLRLLYCYSCHSLEELPDYKGNPDHDGFLNSAIEKHKDASGAPHMGRLMDVPLVLWNNATARDGIVKQIYAEMSPGLDAIAPGYYDLKNNISSDALRCYVQHNKPKDGNCSDWHAKNKEIRPDTKAERKDAGLDPNGAQRQWTCSACPVAIVRQQKFFESKGV